VQFTIPEMQGYLDYRKNRDVLSKEGPPKSEYVDRQLAKAEEYVIEKTTGEKKSDSTAKADAAKPPEKAPEKSPEKSPSKKPDAKDDGAKPESKDQKESKNQVSLPEALRRLRELPRQVVACRILAT